MPLLPFSQFYFIRNTRERLTIDGQLLLVVCVCVSINVMCFSSIFLILQSTAHLEFVRNSLIRLFFPLLLPYISWGEQNKDFYSLFRDISVRQAKRFRLIETVFHKTRGGSLNFLSSIREKKSFILFFLNRRRNIQL